MLNILLIRYFYFIDIFNFLYLHICVCSVVCFFVCTQTLYCTHAVWYQSILNEYEYTSSISGRYGYWY